MARELDGVGRRSGHHGVVAGGEGRLNVTGHGLDGAERGPNGEGSESRCQQHI